MKQVTLVVGTRPNFVKAASLYAVLKEYNDFCVRLVHTGQHYDDNMADIFFRELNLPQPDLNLNVGSGTQTWQIAQTMLALEPELIAHCPDILVTVGDVNATLAASLVASKLHICLAHVEAGLRSYDRRMSEETNRIIADALSDHLFTTSADADEILLHEGIPPHKIHQVGNVMVDTLLRFRERALSRSVWQDYGLTFGTYGLVTLHRAENVDDPEILTNLMGVLQRIAGEIPLLFPVHPRTRARLQALGLALDLAENHHLHLVEPLGYLSFLSLMCGARIVLSDSGGIQAETTVLGVPCLTLRDSTEYTITLSEGTNHLVGTNPNTIWRIFRQVLQSSWEAKRPLLWDGEAATRIAEILRSLN